MDLHEILQAYRIRQHNSTCVQNPLSWQPKREQWPSVEKTKLIVSTNVLTIFQLETARFIS